MQKCQGGVLPQRHQDTKRIRVIQNPEARNQSSELRTRSLVNHGWTRMHRLTGAVEANTDEGSDKPEFRNQRTECRSADWEATTTDEHR